MKTIVDVVNVLRGDLNNLENPLLLPAHIILFRFRNEVWATSNSKEDEYTWGNYLCITIEEFNQCVEDMSKGLFVPLYIKKIK